MLWWFCDLWGRLRSPQNRPVNLDKSVLNRVQHVARFGSPLIPNEMSTPWLDRDPVLCTFAVMHFYEIQALALLYRDQLGCCTGS